MSINKEKDKGIPQLDRDERLELQNIMLKMALEQERVMRFESQISSAQKEVKYQESRMKLWQVSYDKKLKDLGIELTVDQINIDAETGIVSIANIQELPER